MRKWILLIPVLCAVVGSCGGNKLKNPGSSVDEILFINDTSENIYRITVVGTSAEFTLRSSTQKTVRVPREGSFNVNIERTEGSGGQVRMSAQAKAGDTVRIYTRMRSWREGGEILVEVLES